MNVNEFKVLQEYYRQCFDMVDVFHFNSNVAKNQYETYLGNVCNRMIPITHLGIQDHRVKKIFNSQILRIGFIGPETSYKGLPILKQVLERIDLSAWHLDVWGGRVAVEKNEPIYYRGKFNQKNISHVYGEMDLLVVPSICKETFSLVTLEALSYGVPVIVSNNVGAQDVIKEYNSSFVYSTKEELLEKLNSLVSDRTELRLYNEAILNTPWRHDMLNHARKIVEKVYK